ncbi:ATP-binding protein [Winogradskyella sp. DF17]|uniref:histidine kinase n=1 Tax=Winogradskyella pelagia TaxID=2819984 RepID=A0ABS3T5C2_9FLAO|nr:histidine kinase dimerization/phosphoacceptor domain -containing protein [Winogradskyella sp. DF17]MBO3117947.1 ATP-binding protein [Winogradskyella sp. DF17]
MQKLNAQKSMENKETKDTINSLLDLTWKLKSTQPDRGLEILSRIDSINGKLVAKFKEDVVWYYYGILYRYTNKFDLSESYFNKYEAHHKQMGNKRKLAAVNLAKSNMFSDFGNYEKSAEAVAYALKMYEEISDTVGAIITRNKLGYLLSEIKQYEEALQYLNDAAKLAKRIGRKDQEANAYTNKAIIFQEKGQLDSALILYTKAYKIGEIIADDYSKFNNRYNMSSIHQQMKRMDSATYYGQKTIDLSEQMSVPSITIVAKRLMTDLQMDQGNIDQAIKIFESISTNEMKALGLRDKIQNYTVATKAYKKRRNFKKAFENLEKLKLLSDSLTGVQSRNRINELEIIYQSEKKEKQIELLDLQNQNAQLLISRKNRTILIGGIALGCILVLSIILYAIIRKYLRQKKILAIALEEKSLLLKEIHHRVKNNLQLVSSLLTLQGQSITDNVALEAINEGKSRVRSMALIHQDLYQTEDITAVSAQDYLKKLCSELFDAYNIDKDKITLSTKIEPLQIDVDSLIPIGLIINELITNSLKYAFKPGDEGRIQIQLEEEENKLKLLVADNGSGYDIDDVNSHSFGNKLIKSLILQLDGELTIDSANGTRVNVAFKDYKVSRKSKN